MKLWHIIVAIITMALLTLGLYFGLLFGAVSIIKWAWQG